MPLGHVTRYRRSAFDWRFAGRSHTTTECACTPRFSPSLELIHSGGTHHHWLRRRGVPCEPRRVGACSSRSGQCPHCGSWGGCAPPGGDTSGLRKFGQFDAPYGVECGTPVVAVALEAIDGDCGHVTAFAHDGERFCLVEPKTAHASAL
ncbi:hypothetical protein TcBrA4_0052510 [Trypanosoma cruzi]|nr:hypothetical protein TcBrA4_0052510 [Trypanosoma cruzi]